MRKTMLSSLAVIVLGASLFTYNIAEQGAEAKSQSKDYYQLYKKYKAKYEDKKSDHKKLEKKYKKLKKSYDDRGVEMESIYMDLVQCQRTLGGVNPWLEADEEKRLSGK